MLLEFLGLQYNLKKNKPLSRMNHLKTSYIPNTFFSLRYFKVVKAMPGSYAVEVRLKEN